MTPNQIVAYNVAKARALRGWTQEQAAQALAPYLGAKLSGQSFSALERSAWNVDRIKQFSADELLALSRGFDLPIGYFFTPPPPAFDAGLHAPDAPWKGLDPIVLLDAILGTPDNLAYWHKELHDYAASTAPAPRSKREKPNVTPSDLPDRLEDLGATRAKALLCQAFGDLTDASDVLERLAEAIRLLDQAAQDAAPRTGGSRRETSRARKAAPKP
jgi:transcriptional regulator with XRE-family HTH domain